MSFVYLLQGDDKEWWRGGDDCLVSDLDTRYERDPSNMSDHWWATKGLWFVCDFVWACVLLLVSSTMVCAFGVLRCCEKGLGV